MLARDRAFPLLAPAVLALLAAALVAGCGRSESVVCVFAPGACQSTPGGGGPGAIGAQAVPATNGERIRDGAPSVVSVRPTGDGASSTTPVVVVFDESLEPTSALAALELHRLDPTGGGGGIPPIGGGGGGGPIGSVGIAATVALTGDGRVLVFLPIAPLEEGDYEVRVAEEQELVDLTGEGFSPPASGVLGSFSVGASDPVAPRLVTTWPRDGSVNESNTTQLVVAFDRSVQASTVTSSSFAVTVDGSAPTFDPAPSPLNLSGGLTPTTDQRVWTWRSVDAAGELSPLPTGGTFQLALSPAGDQILSESGSALAATIVDFALAPIGTPSMAFFLSQPSDAIGIANLTAGDPEELALQVLVDGGQEGDEVTAFLFGGDPDAPDDNTIALQRQVAITSAAPAAATFSLADLNLLASASPLAARLADGAIAFAFRHSRGSIDSAVRALDVDAIAPGIQDPILDTEAPALLSPEGGSTVVFSDQRDVVLFGRADEPLASVEVSSSAGGNGALPPLVGQNGADEFLAAPIPLDLIDPATQPIDLSIVLYDRALNASAPVTGVSHVQRGRVGPNPLFVGGMVTVDVYDARTLEPLPGALVTTHADDGAGFPLVDATTTALDGSGTSATATVDAAAADPTILSVEAAGYDLFTFHGVPATRLAVPLEPTSSTEAEAEGSVGSDDAIVQFSFPLLGARVADSRLPELAQRTVPVGTCMGGPVLMGELTCPFGPSTIRAERLGAQSLLAGNLMLPEPSFSASTLLQVFELELPAPPIPAGGLDLTDFEVASLLTDPALPPEELPAGTTPLAFVAAPATGIDLAGLVDDPAITGAPRVTVEARVPGVPGGVPLGLGVAYATGIPSTWSVRGAYPGAAAAGGRLVEDGVVDGDLHLRIEIVDADGNRTGRRPRFSTIGALPSPAAVLPPDVPALTSPAAGGNTGGASFTLGFPNTIVDGSGETGLYRAVLEDSAGRRWVLWRSDPPDGTPTVDLRVPDVGLAGGIGLASGSLTCTVAARSFPGFVPSDFLWSDLEREVDGFADAAPISFTQP